jgi:two-component system OmpR family response regulator/two-component system response regulator QseB
MKLLVVDDQAPVGAIVCRIAQQHGWDAEHTTSSHGILNHLKNHSIDALVIDYLIDDQDGLAVIAKLREAGYRLPIMLFTGRPELVDEEAAAKLDVLRILTKPISIEELRTSLNEARKGVFDQKPA